MRKIHLIGLLAASLLSACGGGNDVAVGAAPPPNTPTVPADPVVVKPTFGAQIAFGDSLSDVGTYAVGTVKALGGGLFTINGDYTALYPSLTGLNWTAVLAARLKLPAPCAAQTGLDGDATKGFAVPVENHAGCFGYAQGGARVTNPVGPSNKLTGSPLGALTVPVATQIANHLAVSGGKFKADDMVLVMAGGNDVLFQLGALTEAANSAGETAAGTAYFTSLVAQLASGSSNPAAAAPAIQAAIALAQDNPGSTVESMTQAAIGAAVQAGYSAGGAPSVVAQAQADALAAGNAAGLDYARAQAPTLVAAMSTAGAELATLVKGQILANGAQYVAVNNLPDVAGTPDGRANSAEIQGLITTMVQAFNTELTNALSGDARVLLVDAYALSQATAANPISYGLTNVTDTACDLSPEKNPLESSLACNASNLKPGDVSHYAYADGVHPTPYYYALLAQHVAEKMTQRGWL